jgi:hypothetical protein
LKNIWERHKTHFAFRAGESIGGPFSIPVINVNVSLANNEEPIMNVRKTLFRNSAPKLVIAALPVCLGLIPLQALAQFVNPPNTTRYCMAVGVVMPPNVWTTLRTVMDAIGGNSTNADSADIRHPDNGSGTYLFTLTDTVPQPPTNDGDERTVQFGDQPAGGVIVRDNLVKEVTTTQAFVTGPGVHTIYWLGAPTTVPASPATLALDRSLSVVCTDKRLAPIFDEHPEAQPPLD